MTFLIQLNAFEICFSGTHAFKFYNQNKSYNSDKNQWKNEMTLKNIFQIEQPNNAKN